MNWDVLCNYIKIFWYCNVHELSHNKVSFILIWKFYYYASLNNLWNLVGMNANWPRVNLSVCVTNLACEIKPDLLLIHCLVYVKSCHWVNVLGHVMFWLQNSYYYWEKVWYKHYFKILRSTLYETVAWLIILLINKFVK